MRASCLFIFSFLFFTALVGANPVNTVTVYGVAAPENTDGPGAAAFPSYSLSRLGVGDHGKTSYLGVGVATEVVSTGSATTVTIPTPTTTTFTLIEDGSGFTKARASAVANETMVLSQICILHGTTDAKCVDLSAMGTATTESTFTSVPTPIYTLIESSGARGFWNGGILGVGGITAVIITSVIMILGL